MFTRELLTKVGEQSLVQQIAQTLVTRRGFGWYEDPMEGGQDAYDICLDALDEANAIVDLIRELAKVKDKPLDNQHGRE